mmetsp:Transcript_5157/g.15014  ORF Transcript_5157/g.15014 Transcript_5157/m.15014 type:complete len:631 (+) Transcript_5157:142-2034(+)
MVEDDFPVYRMPNAEESQLDSAKRCLFPLQELAKTSPTIPDPSGDIDSLCKTRDRFAQAGTEKSTEETKHSPISVVSVLNIGQPTLDFNNEKKFNGRTTLSSTSSYSSSDSKENNSRDGVEEQTVIEVQYVEPGPRNHEIDANADSDVESHDPSPNRKNCTEVALHNGTNTSSDCIGVARTRPLLDMEKTPSRSAHKKNANVTSSPFLACGGYGTCLPTCDDSDHVFVERKITDFLEDNSVSTPDALKSTCTDWQAWSYFGFGRPETSEDSLKDHNPSKENIRTTLRRRTSHSLRARKSNVRQIKQNFAPFAQSPARSPAKAPGLFKNRSFSVSEHRSAIVRVSKDKKPKTSSLTNVLELCTMYESVDLDSPDLIRKHPGSKFNTEELSYDSDPEDFMRRRLAPKVESPGDDGSSQLKSHGTFRGYHNSLGRSFFDAHNDEIFCAIVQEMFNQTTTLVLHPLSESNTAGCGLLQSARPVAVDAWLERGQHLAYALIQPKWIWKAKPRIDVEGQSSLDQKFCLQGIELLDITKILNVEETEGVRHSFAKPSHCFLIKSIDDEEFCFEAQSRQERDRVVSSLKLLIARFGAQVLTGDPEAYNEFFWMTNSVPGEAPDLREVLGFVELEEISF